MKQHFTKAMALFLALVMVLSVLPMAALAVEPGESAAFMTELPADGSYGVIYNAGGYVMGFDLDNGKAAAKAVSLNADGSAIPSLPNGAAVVKFIQTGSDYYLTIGGKYLTVKDLKNDQGEVTSKEQLLLTDSVEEGSKWTFVPDKAGAAGYYNIKNAEYQYTSTSGNKSDVYLEQFTPNYGTPNFSPYSYNPNSSSFNAAYFQMKFAATAADDDGRVGEIMEPGGTPVNGTYVIYCDEAKAVFGQPTGADVAAPALLPAAAEVKNDAIAYEDVADGGMIFNVTKNGDVYTFENNGKYLAMPENFTDENGNVGNDETLLMIDWPEDEAKQGYAQWTLTQITGGYRMDNVNARYRTSKCCVEFFNEVFSGWTFKAATPELFAMNFFPMEDKDGVGYVVNPEVTIKEPDPAIGSDCPVEFNINDVSEPTTITAEYYTTDANNVNGDTKTAEVTLEVRKGSFTIPAADLEGMKFLAIRVSIVDELGKSYFGTWMGDIRDEPLILTAFPAANSATGEEKKPEIGVTFANVKENPSFKMLLNGEEVAAAVEGDKFSYTPAEDLADGKQTVSVTITRADGKSVTKSWNFFVGEGGETLYFGQIHAHTAEYSDGVGTLEDAYTHAQGVDDLDFIIITDHSNYFDTTATATTSSYYDLSSLLKNAAGTTTKWEEARATAKEYNELYDDFLCVYGYEMTWSGGPGHTNSFNTYGVVSRNNAELNNKTAYAGMHRYNDLMVNAEKGLDIEGNEAKTTREGAEVTGVNATKYIPFDEEGKAVPVISQFNHPGKTFGNFDNYAGLSAKRDDVLNLIEVGNGEGKVGGSAYFPSYSEYDLCLSMGWHVAPTNNQDNHKGNWGDSNTCRDVILTDDFSEIGLYRALDARRVYATEDQNLQIHYELEANGESFKLGDIAPFDEDEQPETVTIKLNIQEPDRAEKIATVEVIGEGGKTLTKLDVNANEYQGQISLDHTDGYYYVRVVEADGNIAVTAPVWLKEAVPVAADLETSASVAAQGEEETITATLTNGSENTELTLTGYKVEAEGNVLEEQTGLSETVAAGSVKTLSIPFTPSETDPPATKSYEIKVTFDVIYRDKPLTYTKTITETSYPASMMTYIGLDKGHDNFYVSGDYAENDGNFLQICAQQGVICQYIDKGQMTKENLAKYKAIVITVPRVKGDGLPTVWTEDELEALADYTANGGTIVNFSKSDRYDPDDPADAPYENYYSSANLSNMVNEAVGGQTRFLRGIVVDNDMKANEAYRVYFDGRDLVGEHLFTEGIFPASNGQYQWYNGTGIVSDPCLRFKDVNRKAWYHKAVDFALERGLMGGTSADTFEPGATLTREMFVYILWKMTGSPAATIENPFSDVKETNYSYRAILWAVESNITAGRGDGKFERGGVVTRQEMATFLSAYAKYKGIERTGEADLSVFPDGDNINNFAIAPMKWALANNLIGGSLEDDGVIYLKAKEGTTRAQAATVLRNFLGLLGEELPKTEAAAVTLIAPYDTTWVASYKANFTGSSYEPDYAKDEVVAEKDSGFALTTAEVLPGGGYLICSGATFISNYDLKYGVAANEQYENYLLVCNILEFIKNGKFNGEITPIAEVHQGEVGQEFTIEGYVTSNASDYDKDTAFFDCIYIQDETRGINAFPVSGYFRTGMKVRAHGGVTYYCGEIELNLSTDYNGSIQVIDNDLSEVEPKAVTCAEAMSDDNIGNLMKITGTITEIHETAGQVDMIYVDDGSGEIAMLFINGYIQKESHALDGIAAGMMIEGVGIGSRDVDEASGGADGAVVVDDPSLFIKRLRVRARDELFIWAAELDTSELEAAIAEAEALERNLYTPESLAAVDEALAAAQAVMNDPDKTQRQVTEAYNALRAALDALELKTTHDLYAPVTELNDGDVVVIYNPGNGRAVKNDNYRDWYMLASEVTFTEDELIQDPAEDILWTVSIDEEGNYSFSNGENKIVMWLSGSYAEVTNNAAYEGADPLWNLTLAEGETDLYYISSKTIVNGEKKGYLECYQKTVNSVKDFYMTGYFEANPSAKNYGFRFYSEIKPGYYPASTIADGDQVVIYNPGNGRAVKNDNYRDWYMLASEVTFAEDEDRILEPAEDVLWTVSIDEEGNYSFTNGENKIVMWLSGSYAEVTNNAAYEGADPLWNLTLAEGETNLFYISSKTIVNGEKKGYLECYQKTVNSVKDFYMTGYFEANPSAKNYGFRFYKFGYGPEGEPAEVNTAALEAAIAAAQAVDRSLYTEDSLAAMDTALAAAQEVLAKEDKTQAEVNEAAAALNAAVAALVRIPAENADVYELVTEAPADWSGTYLIACTYDGTTYVFNGSAEVNGYVQGTVTDNKITFIEGMEPVVIAPMEGGYSLHVTSGYMYNTASSNKNQLLFDASAKLATIALDESGNAVITSDTTILRFNKSSDQRRFRFFKPTSTSMPLVQLYKLVD